MIRPPIPNQALFELETCGADDILDMFEVCLKTAAIKSRYSQLAEAWNMLFSGLFLSPSELMDGFLAGDHRISEDREAMLREFIRADCALGGHFVMSIISKGGMIDRAALIMIADLKDLAGVVRDGNPAIHLLAASCDKVVRPTLIRKAGKQLLATVYDREGLPVLFRIFGHESVSRFDLEAIAGVFSKEELKTIMVQSRMGRNALEVYTELASALLKKPSRARRPGHATVAGRDAKSLQGGGVIRVMDNSRSQTGPFAETLVKTAPSQKPVSPGGIPGPGGDSSKNPQAPFGTGGTPGIKPDGVSLDPGGLGQAGPGTGVQAGHEKPAEFHWIDPPPRIEDYYSLSNTPIPASIEDKKVLIVDDDQIIRNLIELQLGRLGYTQCVQSESGDDAVSVALEYQPDLIFMDINMPGETDGIAAAIRIREQLNVHLIFLSAYSDPEIVNRAREANPDGYILKPFTDTDLRVTLNLIQ